jgi:hypothetical protein
MILTQLTYMSKFGGKAYMFERINRSWELAKASYAVLRSDKELVVFPIVSFIGVILVTITFAIPMVAAGIFDSVGRRGADGIGIAGLIIGFLFYLVMYTVIIFANTALIGAAMIRLKGGDPTLSDGFNIARSRLPVILGYALISATVGMILRAISERGGIVGQIVASLFGFAWNVATFLAVPVLVVENVGQVDAVKRSASLLKKTWGEQLVANFGIGMVFGLITFGVMIIGVVLIMVFAGLNSPALVALAIIATILAVIAVSLLASTLSGIYQAALYRYATEGDAGEFFAPELIEGAFKEKQKNGIFG